MEIGDNERLYTLVERLFWRDATGRGIKFKSVEQRWAFLMQYVCDMETYIDNREEE